MALEEATRRLTTIVAADVAGYSRLMGADDEGTLTALRNHRNDLIDPKIAEHGGRIANTAGDSILIEFPSVVEALRCCMEIQRGMSERNADVPEDRRIEFRVGINVGDIMEQDGDLLGDGVNVAARLEGLAEPGGVCLSLAVRDQVRDRMQIAFDDMGEVEVKNIARPVRVFRVLRDGESVPATARLTPKKSIFAAIAIAVVAAAGLWWWQPWAERAEPAGPAKIATPIAAKPSIAVLPFTNMSGDKEQEYFSDGMTEDLITDLSKVSGLSVVARNSTFAYKGQSMDIRVIAKELNARYVVEGSVRKVGGRVRINAQLIDAQTGNHMWAERYDRDFKDVFALQDEVLGKIVAALKVTLTSKEQKRLARRETDNVEAYDLFLRGLQQESFFSKEGNLESRRLFGRAVELDPNFAEATAHLAQAYSLAGENNWTDNRNEFANKALALAKKAVALNDDSPQAHWSLGRILTRAPFHDSKRGVAELRRVVALDPNYADGHALLANILTYSGRAEEGLGIIEKAMRMNPRHPFWYVYVLGQAQFYLTRYEDAVQNFLISIERNPTVSWPHRYLLATYGHLGLLDDAEWEISELDNLDQITTIKYIRENSPARDSEYMKLYLDGLRKAGVPEE